MSETGYERMEKATGEELDALIEFAKELERMYEEGCDELEMGGFLMKHMDKQHGLAFSADRIVWGYRTMHAGACDPNLSHLDWKPELKQLVENLPLL